MNPPARLNPDDGSSRYLPPAIQVYSLDASGDAKPLRAITGDKTLLNWPAAMKFDPESGDLYVANDIGQAAAAAEQHVKGR